MKNLKSRVAMLASKSKVRAWCKATLLWSVLGFSSALLAADSELPEMEFLEYLGLWEESDEDWILLSVDTGTQIAAEDARTESEPEGDESAEKEDES